MTLAQHTIATQAATISTDGYMTQSQATKLSGLHQVTVSATAPSSPSIGDIWVDIP
jgi:hypothetical protein